MFKKILFVLIGGALVLALMVGAFAFVGLPAIVQAVNNGVFTQERANERVDSAGPFGPGGDPSGHGQPHGPGGGGRGP